MAITKEDIQDFNRFLDERIGNGGADLTMEQLVFEWQIARERTTTNAALTEALEQMDAGLGQPLDEAMEEIRQRLDLPSE